MTSGDVCMDEPGWKSAAAMLCENLADGLHASAQPLTVLRASLGNPHVDKMDTDDLLRLARNSARQVERLCALFDLLQRLVGAEQTRPNPAATPMEPLMAYAVETAAPLFAQSGIALQATVPDGLPPAFIDGPIALEALENVLAIARDGSQRGDAVELTASAETPDALKIEVGNRNAHIDAPKAEMRLGLALAEAGFRAQQATMRWSFKPFTVSIELPAALVAHGADESPAVWIEEKTEVSMPGAIR